MMSQESEIERARRDFEGPERVERLHRIRRDRVRINAKGIDLTGATLQDLDLY